MHFANAFKNFLLPFPFFTLKYLTFYRAEKTALYQLTGLKQKVLQSTICVNHGSIPKYSLCSGGETLKSHN